ncbi:uncharacterized protein LOC114828386, partial [Galendromus occidentalis]|uniref:Uncharacterized protein LOC114828386 n=1 Tax=Galendromus occidentalis TaxID=34638 RepID=A0AAJ7SGN2_9ACAR
EVVKILGEHSDEPNPAAIQVAARRHQLKRRAIDSQETPLQMIEKIFENSSQATQLVLPSCEGDRMRILLFGRESIGDWIGLVDKIYVDGTFSLSPGCFYRIVVVLAERADFVIPICHALLPNKTQDSYARMIELIKCAWPAFNPEVVSMDYDRGLMNAFRTKFPAAEIQGCLFRLVKNLKLKLAELHLMGRYRNYDAFGLNARMIVALAFVPPTELDNAIAQLASILPPELMPVLKYFEDTYVGSLLHLLSDGSVIRKEPMFPLSMWSVYNRTMSGEARTNNHAEAAHRRLQTEFGVDHPNLWRFIDGLKRVQHHRDMLLARCLRGSPPTKKCRKYAVVDRKLLKLVTDYGNNTAVDFLKGIAANFRMEA